VNLRHLRVFLAAFDSGSVTRAALSTRVTQPAVTQAIGKLEAEAGQTLFRRGRGLFPTIAGETLAARVRRAFGLLDPALSAVAPRLLLTATAAQLAAVIATREAENFTLAARRSGRAQPTIHRAVSQLEREAGTTLFERTATGLRPTRQVESLALAARLAFAELDQASSDLADLSGREVGQIVIGAMPLARSVLVPRAIAHFRTLRPTFPVKVLDGPYADMIDGLRRGEIDFLIGALRDPVPIADVVQERLFDDSLVIVARPGHPVLQGRPPPLSELLAHPFVVSVAGSPGRIAFDALTAAHGRPVSLVETGSMIVMRELLALSDHLGCISRLQIEAEVRLGAVRRVDMDLPNSIRPIGTTRRIGWVPTRAQATFLSAVEQIGQSFGSGAPVAPVGS